MPAAATFAAAATTRARAIQVTAEATVCAAAAAAAAAAAIAPASKSVCTPRVDGHSELTKTARVPAAATAAPAAATAAPAAATAAPAAATAAASAVREAATGTAAGTAAGAMSLDLWGAAGTTASVFFLQPYFCHRPDVVPTTAFRPTQQEPQDEEAEHQQQQQQGSPFKGVLQQQAGAAVYVQHETAALERAPAPLLLRELQRLRVGGWLDDSLLNAFLKQVQRENQRDHKLNPLKVPSVVIVSTFFFARLISGASPSDLASLQRWTRGADIFSHRFLLVPLHVRTVHWALGVADMAGVAAALAWRPGSIKASSACTAASAVAFFAAAVITAAAGAAALVVRVTGALLLLWLLLLLLLLALQLLLVLQHSLQPLGLEFSDDVAKPLDFREAETIATDRLQQQQQQQQQEQQQQETEQQQQELSHCTSQSSRVPSAVAEKRAGDAHHMHRDISGSSSSSSSNSSNSSSSRGFQMSLHADRDL
ncbi:hypothetical protein Emag_002230 [Eimeria magna]